MLAARRGGEDAAACDAGRDGGAGRLRIRHYRRAPAQAAEQIRHRVERGHGPGAAVWNDRERDHHHENVRELKCGVRCASYSISPRVCEGVGARLRSYMSTNRQPSTYIHARKFQCGWPGRGAPEDTTCIAMQKGSLGCGAL